MSRNAAAKRFGVSIASAVRWVARFKTKGEISPAATGGDRRSGRIEAHRDYLLGLVRRRPDMTLLEIQERLIGNCGERFSSSVLWRFFDRHELTFKTYGPPPSARGFCRDCRADQSASTYPASRNSLRPRWRYARSGPHKSLGVERRFLNQACEAPFDCQAISSSPSRKHPRRPAVSPDRRTPYAALGIPVATNRSPRRRTAQAILASLLAKATKRHCDCARSSSAFAHRPSGVSRSAT